MAIRQARTARLEARVTPEQKELFERAAALRGQTLTEFVTQSAQLAAEETVLRHEVIHLSARDSALFVEMLLNPPEPNEALKAAWKEYQSQKGVLVDSTE